MSSSNLYVPPDGQVAVHFDSVTDLVGWSARLGIMSGMSVELQDELDGSHDADFSVPPSLIGRRYELSLVDLDGEPHFVASGYLVLLENAPVQPFEFVPEPVVAGYTHYDHDQLVPSTEWVIVHNLGRFPAVTVTDSAGTVVETDVRYQDSSTVVVTTSVPFGGRAHLT